MPKLTLLVSLFALVLALIFFLFPSQGAGAATLCVNPGGTGGCYASIQAAVNAASPGDTINIATGTYSSDVEINITEAITLQGSGPSTIIYSYIQVSNSPTLSDFTLQIISWTGIRTDCCGTITFKNIRILGDTWGIFVFGGAVNASNLSIYSRDGVVCNMYSDEVGSIIITNSVITTLERYHPGDCKNTMLTNDTFIGTVAPGWNVFTTTNTIFANGCGVFPGQIASLGHNIDSGNNCGLNATGDMTNTNPLLTPPVAVNGVLVNALQPGSPAIDAADDSRCPPTDITGFPRPYSAHCDIGAYEWRPMNFSFIFFPFIAK